MDINAPKARLKKQTSLVPICKMIISIHYCYLIWGTWPRWRQHDKVLLTHFTWHHHQKNIECAILVGNFTVRLYISLCCALCSEVCILGDAALIHVNLTAHQHGERGISRRVWRACKGSIASYLSGNPMEDIRWTNIRWSWNCLVFQGLKDGPQSPRPD